MLSATYDPGDNKFRLRSASRLDSDLYALVKAAGFSWAPRQELFVAPAWTPSREDLLLELCGEIGDEDTSLVERAEDRADRFDDYSDSRAKDATRARASVASIMDGIPLGQPILVGHHSEKHARKDAERIENGMRRAVKMWETASYWKSRAAGALAHAKHMESAPVRARRIKTIEAEKRRQERIVAEANKALRMWANDCAGIKFKDGRVTTFAERAKAVLNYDSVSKCFPLDKFPRPEGASKYEGAMSVWSAMGGDGGSVPFITPEQARDICVRAHERTIAYHNRWIEHLENRMTYEKAMLGEQGGTIADQNTPRQGGAVKCWATSRDGWSIIKKVNKISVTILDRWYDGEKSFTRTVPFDKLRAVMSPEEVETARAEGRILSEDEVGFFLMGVAPVAKAPMAAPAPESADFAAMEAVLRNGGIQHVVANQLFPTPVDLARRMVDEADIQASHSILEPSAGTGRILDAIFESAPSAAVFAVEINSKLAQTLANRFATPGDRANGICSTVLEGDFLEMQRPQLGTFDRILMNPPFEKGSDIRHIKHALTLLNPGGRLVAICADGPRQRAALELLAETWEPLPSGTFTESGTGVNVVLAVFTQAA